MKGLFQCPPGGGSLTHSQALRCSEPLRFKVGGASKPCAILCGMGPPGNSSLQLIVYCLRLISWLFADNLQNSCGFLGGFKKKA